jgi:PAS domain S-box-containing protein
VALIEQTRRGFISRSDRLVVGSAPNGIIVVDAKGRVTLVNTQIEKLFGYKGHR